MTRTLRYSLCLVLLFNWPLNSRAATADAYADPSNRVLIAQITSLARQSKTDELLSQALRNLPIADTKYGKNNKLSADLLMFASFGYQESGQIREARKYYELASERIRAVYGPGSLQFAGLLNNYGKFLQDNGDLRAAATVYAQCLEVKRNIPGPKIEILPSTLLNLAEVRIDLDSVDEATPLLKEAYSILKEAPDRKLSPLVDTLMDLAAVSLTKGVQAKADQYIEQAFGLVRQYQGADGAEMARVVSNRGNILRKLGRFGEAEKQFREALRLFEANGEASTPAAAGAANNLAIVLRATGKSAEAVGLLQRVVLIRQRSEGLSKDTIDAYLNLAHAQWDLGEADPKSLPAHHSAAIGIVNQTIQLIVDSFGPNAPLLWRPYYLGASYLSMSREYEKAIPFYERAYELSQKVISPGDPELAMLLSNYGNTKRLLRAPTDAETLLKQALAITQRSPIVDQQTWQIATNLGLVYYDLHRYQDALPLLRQARDAANSNLGAFYSSLSWTSGIGFKQDPRVGSNLIDAIYRSVEGRPPSRALEEEAFSASQMFSQTEAAVAMMQVGMRAAIQTQNQNGIQLRPLTDLMEKRAKISRQVADQYSSGRWEAANNEALSELKSLDDQIATKAGQLRAALPNLASLYLPTPLKISEAQELLQEEEALLQYDLGAETAYAWMITKTDFRWKLLDKRTAEIARLVQRLRCGLDRREWQLRAEDCKEALGLATAVGERTALPFSLQDAYQLYRTLLEPFAGLIERRRLSIVTSGPLSTIPFSILITERPDHEFVLSLGEYRQLKWLGVRQPIEMIPSVAALALRKNAVLLSRSEALYLGIGNPLLTGGSGSSALSEQAKRWKSCSVTPSDALKLGLTKGQFDTSLVVELSRDGLANPESIKRWPPLPQSAEELCKVAASVISPQTAVLLGAEATEQEVKRRSRTKNLREYRVIHLSTHGLLPSDIRSPAGTVAEPALIMTPPNVPTQDDDGLLSASEIALLDLNADWVILSACNSAGGISDRSEPLSGLARAFLYAGARSVLVSHWSVDAEAASILLRKIFSTNNWRTERAEALRSAIEHMIHSEQDSSASHPEYWAPFVLVQQ